MKSGWKGQGIGAIISQNRTGLVLGGLFGLLTGGLFGCLFGAAVGVFFQRAFSARVMEAVNPQRLFFESTFAVMGRVAKADGRVTEQEISYAREVMARMNLSEDKRLEAIALFTKGKDSDFDLDELLVPLGRLIRFRPDVKQMFVEIQLQAAFADAKVSQAELGIIQQVCSALQVSYADLQRILQRSRSEYAFNQQSFYQHGGQPGADPQVLLNEAYGVLGVAESVSDAELKRAYRKLMSQHHPDKLISKGLPEEMMQLAKEKTQEIQSAYDRVREYRKQMAS